MTKKDVEKLREMGKSNEEIAQITGDMSVLEEENTDTEETEDTVETDAEETEAAEEDAENAEDVEMTKEEARDYVDEQIDEEFMEDVCEQKMSPEKAAKKIKEFEEEIVKINERIEVISPVAEISNLDTLKDLVKEQTIRAVENMVDYDSKESAKEAKDGIKGLESIAFTENLLSIVRSELSSKKQRREFCKKEIENLKAQGYQTNLFEDAEATTEDNSATENAEEVKEEVEG